jgi:hypothetical protein
MICKEFYIILKSIIFPGFSLYFKLKTTPKDICAKGRKEKRAFTNIFSGSGKKADSKLIKFCLMEK